MTGNTLLFVKITNIKATVKGRPCGSVAQLAEYSHGKREALGSSPGRATMFSSPVTFGGQCGGSRLGQRASKVHVSLFLRCSEQIRGRILLSRGKMSKDDHVAR